MTTRRKFIQTLGIAAAGSVVLNLAGTAFGQKSDAAEGFPLPPDVYADPVYSFTSGHFTPFVNTDFQIRAENQKRSTTLRLMNVKDFVSQKNLAEGVTGDCFSLLFYSPRGTILQAGLYEFSHFALGTFNISLNPVSPEPNRYEVIINHLRR